MFALLRMYRLLPGLIFLCIPLLSCESDPRLTPLEQDAIILAFGDSLTYGTGAKQDKSYPAQLQQHIDRTVINAGIPGEISVTGLRRLPYLLKTHQPDLVILCHGANDILRKMDLENTKSNIQKMIHLIRENGSEVILLAVPEFSLFLSPPPFYNELASENNVPLLDNTLSGILLNPALKSDQIHPNADGYLKMALKIKALMEETGLLRQTSNF